jgi:hypothetical protein
VRVREEGPGEVGELASSFDAMADSLERSREELELHVAEPELDRLARLVIDQLQIAGRANCAALYVLDASEPQRGLVLAATDGLDPGTLPERIAGPAGVPVGAVGAGCEELQLPLRSGGLVLGVATLAREGEFADPETLRRMAGAAAVALSNAMSLAAARHQADVNRASISALALEEFSFRRHPHGREIVRMLGYAAVENLGYRQLSDVWHGLAFWDLARRKRSWGEMTRRGFQTAPTEQVPSEPLRDTRELRL